MAQKIFFKEHHTKLNLFGSSDEDRSEIASLTKTRLVVTSNKFGFAAIAYNNAIKIVSISALESSTDQVTPVASIDLDANFECVYLDLDFAETHLYVLTCSMPNENSFEYAIYVYALESVSFDKTLPQSPSCLNRINLERDNQLIVDFCASTNEQEALALCKNNGIVQIVTNLLDKQPKIVSKLVEAFCVCWSPKGKQLACCSRNNKLNLLDRDLTLKNTYECLKPDHIPTNISWLAKKHFIIFGVEASDAQTPFPYYIEVSTDKNSHQSYSIKSIDYSQLTYSFDVEKSPSMDLAFINDWNLILCSNSKNSEIALLQRPPNSEIYDVLEIEDYRCQVPLSSDSTDLCPLGMVVNFNCKSRVKLDKLDLQPPSPMVIILADNGLLITYFVINLDSSNASICIPPSKMQFKSIPSIQQISQKPQSQEQQQPSLGSSGIKPSGSAPTGSMFSFNSTSNNSLFSLNSSQQPTPATIPTANSQQQFNFKSLPSDQSTTILSSSSSTLSQLVTSKTPSQTFPFQAPASTSQTPLPTFSAPAAAVTPQSQPDLSSAQQQHAPFSFAQQPKQPQQVSFNIPPQQQPSQFSAPPKTSFSQFPVQQQQQQQIQPQFEQPKNVVVAPKPAPQQHQQQQQPKSISSISLAEKINEFAKQINELKSSAAKLFDGKELAANLLDYSVIKKSKQVREKYSKINEEMQSLNDKCVELRETLMTDFRNFEKLRLLKFNASNPKIASSMKQYELDPITREKYENIKKLYAYISRELPNIKSHVDLYKKKKQDQSTAFVSFDDVFESIRSIEILINQNSKHVGKLIDQIKLLKIDNNHLIRDLNLVKLKEKPINEEDRKDQSIRDMSTYLEDSLETSKAASRLYQTAMDESDLDKRVSRLELKGAGSSSDRDTLFFTQLYEILRKRKQIPVQEVFLRRLDLYDERFDRVDETTSVTHLDTSSTIHKEISPKTFAPPVTPTATFHSKETTLDSSFLKINSPNVVVQPPQAQPQLQPQASHPPQFGSFAPNTVVVQQSQVQSQPQFQQQQQQQPKIVLPTKPPVADVEPSATLGGSKGILPKFAPPTSTPTPIPTLLPQSGGAQQAPPIQPLQTSLFNFQTAASATSQPTAVVQNVQSQQIQVPKASQPQTTPPHQTQPGPSILGGGGIVNKQQPPPAMSKATTSTPASTSQPSSLGGGLFSFNLAAPSATSSPAPTSQSQPPLFNLPGLSKPAAAAATTSSQPPAFSFGTKSSIATSLFPTTTTAAQQPSEKTEKPAETAKPSGLFTPVTPSQSSDSISVSQIVNTKVAETLSKAVSEPVKKEEAPKVEAVKKDEPAKPTEESSKEKEPTKPDEVKKPIESKQPEPEKTPSTTTEVKPEAEKQPVATTTTDKSEPAKPQSETTPTPQPSAANPAPATTTTTTTDFTLGATTPSMPSLFGTQPSSTTASPFPSLFGAKPVATGTTAAPFSLAQSSSTSTVNPFTAMTSQKPASNELDADMDASTNTMSSGLSFGGLGSSKPLNADAPKNVFGFSFGGGGASQTATSPTAATAAGSSGLIKPPMFGAPATTAATPAPAAGGILKTPTFTSPTSGSTGLFGSSSTGAATGGGGGGLFSQAGSGAAAGGLFSSFKSPESKPPATSIFGAPATTASPPAAFGGAATFGGAPLFGGASAFGASAAPAAAPMSTGLFGSVSSSQTPAFGGAPSFGSTESKPLFGAGALSGQTSGFSTLAAQGGSGATFGTFGQSAQMLQVGFGNLAQQQPQQNLFSSFSQPSQTPSFNTPNSSSFTAYRK